MSMAVVHRDGSDVNQIWEYKLHFHKKVQMHAPSFYWIRCSIILNSFLFSFVKHMSRIRPDIETFILYSNKYLQWKLLYARTLSQCQISQPSWLCQTLNNHLTLIFWSHTVHVFDVLSVGFHYVHCIWGHWNPKKNHTLW